MTSRPEVTKRLVGADCETDLMEEVRLSVARADIVPCVFQQYKMLWLKSAENLQKAIKSRPEAIPGGGPVFLSVDRHKPRTRLTSNHTTEGGKNQCRFIKSPEKSGTDCRNTE